MLNDRPSRASEFCETSYTLKKITFVDVLSHQYSLHRKSTGATIRIGTKVSRCHIEPRIFT